jgi:hypothetical protein
MIRPANEYREPVAAVPSHHRVCAAQVFLLLADKARTLTVRRHETSRRK